MSIAYEYTNNFIYLLEIQLAIVNIRNWIVADGIYKLFPGVLTNSGWIFDNSFSLAMTSLGRTLFIPKLWLFFWHNSSTPKKNPLKGISIVFPFSSKGIPAHSLTHPELTGGIIATSSPGYIVTTSSSSPFSLDPSKSTYSKLTVTKQLCKTAFVIPGYFSSRVEKRRLRGSGAGRVSRVSLV